MGWFKVGTGQLLKYREAKSVAHRGSGDGGADAVVPAPGSSFQLLPLS